MTLTVQLRGLPEAVLAADRLTLDLPAPLSADTVVRAVAGTSGRLHDALLRADGRPRESTKVLRGGIPVLCIGAGGVKSPMLYYLAASGIGTLRVIDFDHVELSNLNRQILFTTGDLGRNKALAAKHRLMRLNDQITIEAVGERVSESNIVQLLSGFDIVIEGGDSVAGRLLVNDYCIRVGIPMVHASAQYNYGYVLTVLPRTTSCLLCVFPDLPEGHGGSVPVIGIATGIAGCLGAGEVIKLATRTGKPLVNGYLAFSAFQGSFDFIPAPRRADCPSCGEGSAIGLPRGGTDGHWFSR